MQSSPLAGRVAFVTGAAGDVGRAVALKLAAQGAIVALGDLEAKQNGLDVTAEACATASNGFKPTSFAFDVTDPVAVDHALSSACHTLGTVDAVVNNAGYQGLFANTADYDPTDFARVLEINVLGVFNVLRSAAREMQSAHRDGSIVNVASMAGVSGAPNMIAYSASKSAVIGLTKSAAKDLAPSNIRVNAVSPAFIGDGMMWERQITSQAHTPSQYYSRDEQTVEEEMVGQIPLRRPGTLNEVASCVSFLLSNESSYVTGVNLPISGGAA